MVTSFWKSTKAFRAATAPAAMARIGRAVGAAGAAAAWASPRPAAAASCSTAPSSVVPLQAPRLACASGLPPGRKASAAASQRSRPRDCEKSCTLGVQPPAISSRSQAMAVARPRSGVPSGRSGAARRPLMRPAPMVSTTPWPASTVMPRAAAAATSASGGAARRSRMTGTTAPAPAAAPASARAKAAA